jgi:8-oxo-dGDP phosphatase
VGEDDRHARTRWTIHDERLIDENRHVRLSIADVTLPDGVRFEQYVMRLPRAALILLLNDRDEVLMMWRHRFIIDRWAWELPGGYVDQPADDPLTTAAREVEEVRWIPLDDTRSMIDHGEIIGAGSIIGLLRVLSECLGSQPAS